MTDDATVRREDASMHRHEHERETARRQAMRRTDHEDATGALAARAAAAGRTDALGPASILRLQRMAGNAGVAQLLDDDPEPESPIKDVVGKGGGTPLEPEMRGRMESSFGADFSDVRVHTGDGAAASARAVDAHAYTVGNEIILGDGHGQGSTEGSRTLAHELTHVVQQRSGAVEGTPAPGGISISSPSDRFERAAEATADRVMTTGRAGDIGAASPATPAIQRQDAPEDETGDDVQELAIQREDADIDDEEHLLL
jgi:hypothetical protein